MIHVESHVDDPTNNDASKFLNLLESTDLVQNVTSPTHRHGHILDLVLSRESDNIVSKLCVKSSDGISDHSFITCNLKCSKPALSRILVKQRSTKNIKLTDLEGDVKSSSLLTAPLLDVNGLTGQYNDILSSLFDQHAPVKEKWITLRPNAPWFNDELHSAKQEKRRAERRYVSTGLEIHKQIYSDCCKSYNKLLTSVKTDFYNTKISSVDQSQLFKLVSQFFHSNKNIPLPKHETLESLVDDFNNFFINKIENLRHEIDTPAVVTSSIDAIIKDTCSCSLTAFQRVSPKIVNQIIMASPTKPCPLDPIPSGIIKSLKALLPTIQTLLIYQSLLESFQTNARLPSYAQHSRNLH